MLMLMPRADDPSAHRAVAMMTAAAALGGERLIPPLTDRRSRTRTFAVSAGEE